MNEQSSFTDPQANQPKQRRIGAKILIAALFIVAVIGIGYGVFAWQQNEVKGLRSEVDSLKNQNQLLAKEKSDKPATVPAPSSTKGYFVLGDWGIKIKMPEDRKDVEYYKEKIYDPSTKSTLEYYDFTTKKVEGLGVRCVESDDMSPLRLAHLSRVKELPKEIFGQEVVNEGKPINGYYYLLTGAHSACDEDGSANSTQIQVEDRKFIIELLKNPFTALE